MHTRNLPPVELNNRILSFQLNASFWPVWSLKNNFQFYNKLYEPNSVLPEALQVNVYPSDVPFAWSKSDSADMLHLRKNINQRDSVMAYNIINKFNQIKSSPAPRKKALVITNFRHSLGPEVTFSGGRRLRNTTYYFLKEYGNKTANVLLNSIIYSNERLKMIPQGNWDAAFAYMQKESVGFNFKGSPLGKDSFDIWPYKTTFLYQDVFTGFFFYLPVEKHFMVEGTKDLVD